MLTGEPFRQIQSGGGMRRALWVQPLANSLTSNSPAVQRQLRGVTRKQLGGGTFNRNVFEHKRAQAPGLPMVDPFVGHGFNADEVRRDPDVVWGEVGLVSRAGGLVMPNQMDLAMEAMENVIDSERLAGLSVKRRDLGESVPVTRTSLRSRLPAHIRQLYGGRNGEVKFRAYTLRQGSVIFEIHVDWSVFKKDRMHLVRILYVGAMQIGITCVPHVKGLVDAFDDHDHDSRWNDKRMKDVFARPQEGYVPENTALFKKAGGGYTLGNPTPAPLRAKSVREKVRWKSEEDRKNYDTKWTAEHAHLPTNLENSLTPREAYGKPRKPFKDSPNSKKKISVFQRRKVQAQGGFRANSRQSYKKGR